MKKEGNRNCFGNFLIKNFRGQVTIFIIVAIVIVVGVALFFVFRGGIDISDFGGKAEKNPSSFLESCLEDEFKEVIEKISLQGGKSEPDLSIDFKFEGEPEREISYICYTQNYYIPCVNQEPMLIQSLKNEIKNSISNEVGNCFDSLAVSLGKQGYSVNPNYRGFEIELRGGKVAVKIDAEISLTKSGETTKQEEFEVVVPSEFYGLALVAQEITSQEAEFCNFEYLGYMSLYPEWKIKKIRTDDNSLIYTIENKDSEEKFRFAIRGCVIRPGV